MRFRNAAQAIRWYDLVRRQGLYVPYAHLPWRERIHMSPRGDLDVRLGEAALVYARLHGLVEALPDEKRRLLLDTPDRHLEAAALKRRARARDRLLRTFKPALIAWGLLDDDSNPERNPYADRT